MMAEAEGIWSKKPKRWEYAELRLTRIMTGTFGLYRASEIDIFHEKVREFYHDWIADQKAELDRFKKEGLEHHAIAVEYYEKLEAIKTFLIEAKAQGRISMSVGFSLDKILEAED